MIFLRKILQISAIIVALFGVVFFTDLGRSIFLNSVVFFLKTKNVELIVEGVDGRKIRKIFIRSADKTELTLLNVIWNQNSFFDKLSIGIDDFIFKKDNFRDGSVGNSGKVLLWISKIKEFIKDFSVTNGSLCFSDKVYSINNFCYESREDKDHLSVKIGDWNLRYLSAVAKSSATAYEFSAENDKIKIAAVGRFDDFMSEIKIDTVAAEYQNFVQKGQGYLCLSRRNANIKTEIDCENFLNLISPILVENFKNLRAHSDINFDFTNGLTCRADSVLKKNAASVGNLKCFYEKGKIKITSNVSGIRVFGFGFSGIDCKINEEKMADITLFGEDFKIISNIKIRDRIFVENFELTCPKGTVKSSGSFFIGEECCFDFDFNQLDFWNRIFPISGSGSGNFSCKNGMIFGKGKFPKLILNNKKFSSLNFSVSEKKILAVAESAKIFGIELKDLNFETSDHNFNLYAKVNETGILNAAGEIRKSFKKILLKNAEIKFPSCKIKIENSLSDATKNRYWINCTLSDKKKLGEVKADYANEAVTVDFSSFPLDKFLSIFNYNMPSCRLSGSINLKAENGNFIGEGKISALNFIAHKRDVELDFKCLRNGIKISADTKRQKDFVNVSAFVPIVFRNDGSILKNLQGNFLDCRLTADAALEKMLEFSDNADLRGRLKCDFRLGGSFEKPEIFGSAELRRACIAVGNILLQNGTISLNGNGGRIINVSLGEFIDAKKRKALISGTGKLFFDGIVPNLDLNLGLKFGNFALFDSENSKIVVNGNGAMVGPLNDITIKGDIVVPKCEIQNFATEDEKPDVVFENDPYLKIEKKQQDKRSFFKYDISMRCNDITFIGKNFEIHLRGNLSLSTYSGNGTLIGNLNLLGGKLDLFGKRLNFTEGKVTFLPEFPYDPKATFTCQKNLGDINVALEIKSSPRKGVSLNLSSTPNCSQDVILSKILFGKEIKYLSLGEAAQLANAVAGLKQNGYFFSVLNTFQSVGAIDNISFSGINDNQSDTLYTNRQSASSKNDMNISAGKYISDNVYISVNKNAEGASFDIDFSVTPRISVKASTTGETGISWKYRY